MPLQSVNVDATVHDTLAVVSIKQSYLNPAQNNAALLFGRYIFPLHPSATVTSMTATINGTRVLTSQVMEKTAAKATYNAAVTEKRTAALLTSVSLWH